MMEAKKFASLKAKDIMQRQVIKVTGGTTVTELIKLFQQRRITGAPVVDDLGNLIGVVSKTDLVRTEAARASEDEAHAFFKMLLEESESPAGPDEVEPPGDFGEKIVDEIMTPWVITAEIDAPVRELARRMLKEKIHRILIVDARSQLKGIVTTMDLARAIAEHA